MRALARKLISRAKDVKRQFHTDIEIGFFQRKARMQARNGLHTAL